MTVTLVIARTVGEQLQSIAHQPMETAGVLLTSVVDAGAGNLRLLAREFIECSAHSYVQRLADELVITSDGYVPALARAEALKAVALWVHTHPGEGALPLASEHDRVVDSHLAETFRLRTCSDCYGTLILSPRGSGLAFSGFFQQGTSAQASIDRMWLVGERLRLTRPVDSADGELNDMFDRNVRALGRSAQETLGAMTVGIVGCGGTGSAVAEQLVRLGVRQFVLIDPDKLSISNVTRVYGSTPNDVGRLKVEVLNDHLRRIAPHARCERVPSMLTVLESAKSLTKVDVVFGCTDDNAGRLVLSRMPTYLLTPIIDCGVLISTDPSGTIVGIDGRVTTILPEGACLLCRGRIDVPRAGAELLTPTERKRLEDEGYAPALGATEPAVVTFTTMVAASAVSELLERLVGYGPQPRPSEVLHRFHEREISTNLATPLPGHYCNARSGIFGAGLVEPYLELAWTA